MNNGLKAEIVFKEELEYIKSENIKEYVLKCFEKLTPDYFWVASASSSGKFHPIVARKKHGLVLHTKLCVWWGRKLAETYDCEKDIETIIASLLLHDLQKFGQVLDEKGKPSLAEYSSSHGPVLAIQLEKILEEMYDKSLLESEEGQMLYAISSSVCLHMGRWTNSALSHEWTYKGWKSCEIVDVVHMADYCASRKADGKMAELDKYEFPYME
jgi:hypothetical protein